MCVRFELSGDEGEGAVDQLNGKDKLTGGSVDWGTIPVDLGTN